MTSLAYPEPSLGDEGVTLRAWQARDLGCVEEASRDPGVLEGTTLPRAFTPEEGRAWISRQWGRLEQDEGLSLAVADPVTDEALGACVLMRRRQPGTAAIGYWVVERARGRGLASRAVGLLAPWALRGAGMSRVEALVEPGNAASQRVLERAGFRREGLLRSYLVFDDRRADALIYSLLPGDIDSG